MNNGINMYFRLWKVVFCWGICTNALELDVPSYLYGFITWGSGEQPWLGFWWGQKHWWAPSGFKWLLPND